MNAALLSSKNMCWCTPQDFFDKLNAEFGFVLDPAATDKTAKCSLYYTPETDGLSQSWDRGGAVFCNPPYGREIGKWVQKAFEEARGGYPIVLLITCEEYRLLRGNIPALPDRWWWTATPDSPINSFVRIVYSDGSLYNSNAYFGTSGVRPLCNLKSEILVSYLNGENAEEQKKRAEAVDMMKHIAAAWDIDAEEVFGRADE